MQSIKASVALGGSDTISDPANSNPRRQSPSAAKSGTNAAEKRIASAWDRSAHCCCRCCSDEGSEDEADPDTNGANKEGEEEMVASLLLPLAKDTSLRKPPTPPTAPPRRWCSIAGASCPASEEKGMDWLLSSLRLSTKGKSDVEAAEAAPEKAGEVATAAEVIGKCISTCEEVFRRGEKIGDASPPPPIGDEEEGPSSVEGELDEVEVNGLLIATYDDTTAPPLGERLADCDGDAFAAPLFLLSRSALATR